MSTFSPIPFEDLIRRVFHEYHDAGKIFGLAKEKFFAGAPGVNLAVNYLGQPAATPYGPAAGPHTQLAQNIVLAWLTGARIMELKTVQILDRLELPRPCIDVETLGFNVEWSQELPLAESLREYVKAWMLIEMIKATELLGEEFSKQHGATLFDLSVGYDFKGIKSEKIHAYLQGLKNASATIDALREEIPPEFARLRKLAYPPQIIHNVNLSTFHGCPPDEIDNIVSHLLTEHRVNVIVKVNPTLLGPDEVAHILHDVLGYRDLTLVPKAFADDLKFDQAIELMRSMFRTAASCGQTLGLKLTNTLVVKNQKGYFADDLMYLSGPPLHVLAVRLLQKVRAALGNLHPHIPTAFSAGVDEKNFADALSLNLVPVTVCTDLLKVPGYEKGAAYSKRLAQQMDAAGAINLTDYIMKRFGHAAASIHEVFDALRQDPPHAAPDAAIRQRQQRIFDDLQARVLTALQENSDSLELLTTDALIVTQTLERYNQEYGESFLLPHTFRELYESIVAAAAARNLEAYLAQIMQDPRYAFAKTKKTSKKLPNELALYDCASCGRCIAVCPNNANFAYYVKPAETPYRNYQLTEAGLRECDGGVFTLKKFFQIANFDDCCNQCSVCAIHCVETGKPYQAKPKYFGSEERWAARADADGFWLAKCDCRETITGRLDGKTYTLTFDREANQITFGDGVIEGVFEYPAHAFVKLTALDPRRVGHTLDMRAYHVLLTQLTGALNAENGNYVNVKYNYALQKALLPMRGVILALPTPFTGENQVDAAALGKHVQAALAAGVAGLIVLAAASEVEKLTAAEQTLIVKTVVAEVNRQVPVLGSVAAATADARQRQAQQFRELGCDGVVVNIPYANDRQYTREVWELADLKPGIVLLQDSAPVALLKQLFDDIEALRGLAVEASAAGGKATQALQAARCKLHVSGHWAAMQMIEALDRGVHAVTVSGLPEIYAQIHTRYHAGQRAAAQELFDKLLPLLAFAGQHPDLAIYCVKRLLVKQGIYTTANLRAPHWAFDARHEKIAEELIARALEMLAALPQSA